MTRLCFIDTETTGLTMGRHPLWEVAIIVREDGEPPEYDREWLLRWRPELATAEPMALSMTGYWTRRPGVHPEVTCDEVEVDANDAELLPAGVAREPWDSSAYPITTWTMPRLATLVATLTAGSHMVGAVPDFDAYRLDQWLRDHGAAPAWHYHLVDIEPLMAGYLAGQAGPTADRNTHRWFEVARPPWRSKDLAELVGSPHTGEAHTAMDDARWARDCYDAVLEADMATAYPCPLGTCDWELVDDWIIPPPPSALASVFGTGVLTSTAAATHAQEVEAQLQAHVESHPLDEWVTEVARLNALVDRVQAAATAAQHVLHRDHPHSPGRCDGCKEAERWAG